MKKQLIMQKIGPFMRPTKHDCWILSGVSLCLMLILGCASLKHTNNDLLKCSLERFSGELVTYRLENISTKVIAIDRRTIPGPDSKLQKNVFSVKQAGKKVAFKELIVEPDFEMPNIFILSPGETYLTRIRIADAYALDDKQNFSIQYVSVLGFQILSKPEIKIGSRDLDRSLFIKSNLLEVKQ